MQKNGLIASNREIKANGAYFGMMDKLSESAMGKWSTFLGFVDVLKKQFGGFLLDSIKPIIEFFGNTTSGIYRTRIAMILLGSVITAILIPASYNAAIAGWLTS